MNTNYISIAIIVSCFLFGYYIGRGKRNKPKTTIPSNKRNIGEIDWFSTQDPSAPMFYLSSDGKVKTVEPKTKKNKKAE